MSYELPTLYVLPIISDSDWLRSELAQIEEVCVIGDTIGCANPLAAAEAVDALRKRTGGPRRDLLRDIGTICQSLQALRLPDMDTAYRVAIPATWQVKSAGPAIEVDGHGFGFDDLAAAEEALVKLGVDRFLKNQSDKAGFVQLLAHHLALLPEGFTPVDPAQRVIAAAHSAGLSPAAMVLGDWAA